MPKSEYITREGADYHEEKRRLARLNYEWLQSIAEALPGEWYTEPTTDTEGNPVDWYGAIERTADGLRLFVSFGTHDGKCKWSVTWPRNSEGLTFTPKHPPTIGMTTGKKAAADDLMRRLLPEASKQYARKLAERDAREQKIANADDFRHELETLPTIRHRSQINERQRQHITMSFGSNGNRATVNMTPTGGYTIHHVSLNRDKLIEFLSILD